MANSINLHIYLSTLHIYSSKMSVSRIRQNYHEDAEALVNKQINMEFYASYVYLSMASYFNRDEQALHGFASFFRKQSDEERAHGIKLMDYKGDAHLCDFLESEYLNEQVDSIKEIADMITKIKRAGDGLGLHLMDKEMS